MALAPDLTFGLSLGPESPPGSQEEQKASLHDLSARPDYASLFASSPTTILPVRRPLLSYALRESAFGLMSLDSDPVAVFDASPRPVYPLTYGPWSALHDSCFKTAFLYCLSKGALSGPPSAGLAHLKALRLFHNLDVHFFSERGARAWTYRGLGWPELLHVLRLFFCCPGLGDRTRHAHDSVGALFGVCTPLVTRSPASAALVEDPLLALSFLMGWRAARARLHPELPLILWTSLCRSVCLF